MRHIITLLLLASCALRAEPITLTRTQAFELHAALSAIAPGLNPSNAIVAADNINALEPAATAYRAGQSAYARFNLRNKSAPDAELRLADEAERLDAKNAEPVTIDVVPLDVSADEIKEAKIAPAVLAPIRRWLRPKGK